MLSFGDPSPFVERIRQAGTLLIIQVTDLGGAKQAVDLDCPTARQTEARPESQQAAPRNTVAIHSTHN
jgi:nitronate monooxygenase